MGHGGSALLFPIPCLVSFITKWHLSVGRPWSVLRSTGTLAWPRGTGPFFPAPGPLAHWPGSLALIGSFAHWLICTGLASFAWPHLFIASSAPWRWPNWLIGSLALASLAHLLLAHWALGSGLIFGISRAFLLWPQAPWLLGAHCTICSFAHWLILASLAHLLNGSLAHWLICAFFGIYRAHLAQASFLAYLELFCSSLRTLVSQGYLTSSCLRWRLGS